MYDLPTEAQWERACRAGTTTPFSFGETITTDQANYNGTRYDGTQPNEEDFRGVEVYASGPKGLRRKRAVEVATLGRNPWGLYDMHGNVSEWCLDRLEKYPSGAVTDPSGRGKSGMRVLRGGSWGHGPAPYDA